MNLGDFLRTRMRLYFLLQIGLLAIYFLLASTWAYLAVGLVSVLGIVIGVLINRPGRRFIWLLLGAGTLIWVAGDLAALLSGDLNTTSTSPTPSSLFYLVGFLFLIAFLGVLLRERSSLEATSILDTAAIITGVAVLVWSSAIVPYFESQSPAGVAVTVMQIILNMSLVGLAIRLVLTRSSGNRSSALLKLGLLALIVANVVTYTFTIEALLFWRLLDLGWLGSYIALGGAVLHPSVAQPIGRAAARSGSAIVSFLGIAAGGLVLPLFFLPHVLAHHETDLVAPLVGGVIFFGLALARMSRQGKRIRAAEHSYRTLVEQTPAVSYIAEVTDGVRITYISPQVKRVLGYEPSELVDNPKWRRIIHPDDMSTALSGFSADMVTTHESTFRMIAKGGSTVWVSARVRRTSDTARHLWQGIVIDISDQMKIEDLESALRREREAVVKLQALDEMKNGFLQAVSHELRTPLTSIKGLGATLENHLPNLPFEDVADLIRRINVNASKLEGLLADLLDVDRLSRGIFLPKLAVVDVGSIVAHAAELAEVPSQRMFVACDPVEVLTDGAKVERIAENLISNAIKHTPADCSIWIRVQAEPEGVLISVEDSGAGIDDEMRQLIFEPFGQWESERSHSQGLGLGLSLVKRFAELLDGRAWVEDRPGGGASFKVFLPSRPNEMKELEGDLIQTA